MKATSRDQNVVELALRERVKELSCLFGVADIIERSGNSVELLLSQAVSILPGSWKYAEFACARIVYKSFLFATPLFRETTWIQKSDILEGEKVVGSIEIHYLKQMPLADEGPFLSEERKLLDAVSKSIGKALERISTIDTLKKALDKAHDDIVILQNDKNELIQSQLSLCRSTRQNINLILMPLIKKLTSGKGDDKEIIHLLEENLRKPFAPFLFQVDERFSSLTTTETQIVRMIQNGRSTKQIARIRGVSESTVHHQREQIRKKIGLANKKINLSTYLTLMGEGD